MVNSNGTNPTAAGNPQSTRHTMHDGAFLSVAHVGLDSYWNSSIPLELDGGRQFMRKSDQAYTR